MNNIIKKYFLIIKNQKKNKKQKTKLVTTSSNKNFITGFLKTIYFKKFAHIWSRKISYKKT